MNTELTAAVKSVLDKSLHDLTEDDISQLTREDCRRYLKEKGMRRPSWNKSQAIQQVICLKSLLEPTSPHPVPKPAVPATDSVTSNSSSSVKELSPADADGSLSGVAEDGGLDQPQPAGLSSSEPAREGECCPPVADAKAVPVRSTDVPHLPTGQMTIFYCGKVNVYDRIPVDKARAILHLAGSPIQICQDDPTGGNSIHCRTPGQLPASSVKFNRATPDAGVVQFMLTGKVAEPTQHCRSDGNILHEQDVEGQKNRQVSLQRYLEKRKDRGKFKMKRKIGSSSSGLEMYLNHPMRLPVINGQTTQNNNSFPSQPGLPCTGYVLIDKQQKNHDLPVDLNEKDCCSELSK